MKSMNITGIPLTMKFNGIAQRIAKTINNYLNILSANHKSNRIFGRNSIIVAIKRENNLRDCFIRSNSKLYRDNKTVDTPGTTNCHDHDATLAVFVITICTNDTHRKTDEERLICKL